MSGLRRLFIALFLVWPLAARADDADMARARFKEGVEYFDRGQFDKARAAFLQAYALKKHPSVVLNLAQSCLKAHRDGEAARWFKQYLADKDATPAGTATAERGLADARTRDARLELRAPHGAEVFIDDQSVGVAPIDLYDVEPGTHVVRLKDGTTQSVAAAPGAVTVVALGGPALPPPTSTTATTPPPPATGPERPLSEMLGGPGESCRARADCEANLVCMDHTCVDPNHPPPPKSPPAPAFELRGLHAFVGLAVRGGPAWLVTNIGGVTAHDPNLAGSFAFALRAGVFANRNELAVELSPFTDLAYRNLPLYLTGPAFAASFTYGYYAPLYEGTNVGVYWPLRVGVGVLAGGNNTSGLAYLQGRLDLIGFAVRVHHVMFGVDLPSFRYLFTPLPGGAGTVHVFAWRGGVTFEYLF